MTRLQNKRFYLSSLQSHIKEVGRPFKLQRDALSQTISQILNFEF